MNDHHLVSADVASLRPNPWGLYDMNGNVAEWTRSDYHPYPLSVKAGKLKIEQKAVKGGSWRERPRYSTCAIRKPFYYWQKPFNVGFRVIIEE